MQRNSSHCQLRCTNLTAKIGLKLNYCYKKDEENYVGWTQTIYVPLLEKP